MTDSSDAAPRPPGGAPSDGPRPTRAEMRRAAEAEAARSASSRVERRRLEEQQAKEQRRGFAPWRAWWLYPLVALIGLFVYLGIQSAADAPPPTPPVVEVTDAP